MTTLKFNPQARKGMVAATRDVAARAAEIAAKLGAKEDLLLFSYLAFTSLSRAMRPLLLSGEPEALAEAVDAEVGALAAEIATEFANGATVEFAARSIDPAHRKWAEEARRALATVGATVPTCAPPKGAQ